MGWLMMQSLGGHATPRAYLDHQFTYENDGCTSKVVRSAMAARVYYAAIERVTKPGGEREVWAAVCLVRHNPKARDGYVFGYKDMEESMGPCYYDCPAAILDLLTPTSSEYALGWRQKCRAAAEQRRLRSAKPKPRPGQIIQFEKPLAFSNGLKFERMEVVANPLRKSGVLFRPPGQSGLYRIPGVRNLDYRLEPASS